jgi:mRNA interferase RelE/StbE
MSLRVILEEKAINRLAGFLADDPQRVAEVLGAIDDLADAPRPSSSFPFGSQNLRRLRIGRYRVLYEIEADVISIGHIARTTASD